MRKIFLLLAAAVAGSGLIVAKSNTPIAPTAFDRPADRAMTFTRVETPVLPTKATPEMTLSDESFQAGKLSVSYDTNLYPNGYKLPKQKAAPAINDLTGARYVMLRSNSNNYVVNYSTTVSVKEGNTLLISPFVFTDVAVTADYNPTTGDISIPVQKVTELEGGNVISICPVDIQRSIYSTTEPLKCHLYGNNIVIDGGFGFFVTEGPKKGAFLNVGFFNHGAVCTPNSEMKTNAVTFKDNTLTVENKIVTEVSSSVFAYPTGESTFNILGTPINAQYIGQFSGYVGYDGGIYFDPQPQYTLSFYGTYYLYGGQFKTDDTGKVTISVDILDKLAGTLNKTTGELSIGPWFIARSGSLIAMNQDSKLKLPFTPATPTLPTMSFSGEGTQASPWLIKTAQDLYNLSVLSTNSEEYRGAVEPIPFSNSNETFTPVFKGKYFRLDADIDMATLTDTYLPIGSKQYQFSGTFDGNGKTISNFTIVNYAFDCCGMFAYLSKHANVFNLKFKNPYISTLGYTAGTVAGYAQCPIDSIEVEGLRIIAADGYNVGGIVGYADIVTNCKVTNCVLQSLGFMGGIAGRSYNDIKNCSVKGTLQQSGKECYTGGIIGHATKHTPEQPSPKILECTFSGNVSSSLDQIGLGGIAGCFSYCDVERCVVAANIIGGGGPGASVGSMAGSVFSTNLKDCFGSGWVRNTSSAMAGGITGHGVQGTNDNPGLSTMQNCISTAMLETGSTSDIRGLAGDGKFMTVTNSYYDNQISPLDGAPMGAATSFLTSGEAIPGFSADVWTFTKGQYPTLKAYSNDATKTAAAALIIPEGENIKSVSKNFEYTVSTDVKWYAYVNGQPDYSKGYAFSFDNGIGKLNMEQYTDTIFATTENAFKYYFVNIAPVLFEGAGTEADPWKINNKADLKKLSDITNQAAVSFEGKYFVLTGDIDFGNEKFTPICKDPSKKLQFMGTFDGKGFTIKNLWIEAVAYYTEDDVPSNSSVGAVNPKSNDSYYYSGLFANLGAGGVVKNLTMGTGCRLDAFSYGGMFVGNNEGTVQNCRNYGDVIAFYAQAGGIVGQQNKGGVIDGCYNEGKIITNNNVAGGIVGQSTTGTITNCYNAGDVIGVMVNVYQKPNIQKTVGGIAGNLSGGTIANCSNSGTVRAYSEVGGIAGKFTATAANPGRVENVLNYGFVYSINDVNTLGAITGVSTLTTYDNCITDSRLQHLGLVANGAKTGTKAMETSEIAGNSKLFPADNWTVAEKCYPVQKIELPAQAILNSQVALGWSGNDFAGLVSSPVTLPAGLTYTLKGGEAFKLAGDKLTVTVPTGTTAMDTLVAASGSVQRMIPLQSFNVDLYDGDGTEASPFIIATADDFLKMAALVNSTKFDYTGYNFKQTADLDFAEKTFTPAGISGSSFNGIYDGGNFKFKNLKYVFEPTNKDVVTGGIFGVAGFAAVLKNIILDETSQIATYSFPGGLAGHLYGTVDNFKNYGTITNTATANAGGVAAKGYPGAKISNSANYGAVTAKTSYAGGILGYSDAYASIAITNCVNEGYVKGTSKIGGIVGAASVDLLNCTNKGMIETTSNYGAGIIGEPMAYSTIEKCINAKEAIITGSQYSAGIFASSIAHVANQVLAVTDCHNYADIECTKGWNGGIAASTRGYITFRNCSNHGKISVPAGQTSAIRVGGIVGSPGNNTDLYNCYNTGTVIGYTNSGGLIGYFNGGVISDCYNTGEVIGLGATTAANMGGISGNGPIAPIRCWNSGNVTSPGQQIGGLNGTNTAKENVFTECWNSGTIKGAGKVAGLVGAGRGWFENCANYGEVIGDNNVAGISAYPGAAQAETYISKFKNVLNTGKITTTGTNYGAIAAENTGCKYISFENCYYDKDVVTAITAFEQKYEGIKGLTTAELTTAKISDSFVNATAMYPVLKAFTDSAEINFAAALVLLADGDTFEKVTKDFLIGQAKGLSWTSTENLKINGNTVEIFATTDGESASLVLTGAGKTRTYNFKLYKKQSGIGNEVVDGAEVISEEFYTLDGRKITIPANGQIVIRKANLSNGKSKVEKVVIVD